jgi:hypothetical protein
MDKSQTSASCVYMSTGYTPGEGNRRTSRNGCVSLLPPHPTGHVQGVIADSSGQQFQVLSKGLLQLKSAMRQQQADVEALSHTERTGASGGEDGEAGSMESHAPAAAAAAAAEDPWLTERDAEGGAITYSFDAEEGGLSDSKQQKPGYKM